MALMTDLEVPVVDRPGTAAAVGETLGAAGINIEGVCGHGGADGGVIHVLVAGEATARARAALADAGLHVAVERRAHVVQCPDRAGEMGRVLRRLATADINVDVLYLTTTGQLAVAAADDHRLGELFS
jgi:hypothetical protein